MSTPLRFAWTTRDLQGLRSMGPQIKSYAFSAYSDDLRPELCRKARQNRFSRFVLCLFHRTDAFLPAGATASRRSRDSDPAECPTTSRAALCRGALRPADGGERTRDRDGRRKQGNAKGNEGAAWTPPPTCVSAADANVRLWARLRLLAGRGGAGMDAVEGRWSGKQTTEDNRQRPEAPPENSGVSPSFSGGQDARLAAAGRGRRDERRAARATRKPDGRNG